MNTATIKIKSVETKEGASQSGKPWRLFRVEDEATGTKFSTFDGALGQKAAGAVGQVAQISYETTEKGNDLKALTLGVQPAAQGPVSPPPEITYTWPESDGLPARKSDGPDWDRIGLQKTRCALWAAVLGNADLKEIPATSVAVFARELVIAAEDDIFNRAAGAPAAGVNTDDIPF